MGEVFQNVLSASFQGSVLILAVLLLRPLLKNAPKRFTCLLWILVGLRLLVPLNIESEFSLQPDVPRFELVQEEQNAVPQQPEAEQPQMIPAAPVAPGNPVIPGEDDVQITIRNDAVPEENRLAIDWTDMITYIWLAAVSGLGIYCIVSYLRLKHRVREAVRLENGIWESDRIDTAFILGYLLPRIYLPMYMDERNKRLILEHERSHMKNGDHWVKLIGFIALAVHWFNPLVWVAYILLCRDIEMACDERVIRSMDLEERKSYSVALLSCSSNRAHFAACPVAFGEKPVRKRIMAVLNYRKPGFWITVVALAAVIAVAVFFLTSPVEKVDPMTPEGWEQECRRVLEEIQSSDSYHIRRNGEFEGELVLDEWNQVDYWRCGDDWLMILNNQDSGMLDGVWYNGIYGDLYLDGEYFSGYSADHQMVWNQEAYIDAPFLWLETFDMDEKNAKAISRKDTNEGYEIRLMVYDESDSLMLEYDTYYVDFHFDQDGNFRHAVQNIQATGVLMGETKEQSMVLTMYAFECSEEAFGAAVSLYKNDSGTAEPSPLTYTDSATAYRVTEWFNPTISFHDTTKDYVSAYARYHFDEAVKDSDRDACVYYSDVILARLGLEYRPEIMILGDYDGAWTDGTTIYLGAGDFALPEYGAKLIVNALGGYVNYGAAYGYAEYIAVQEGWSDARSYVVSLTDSDARDLNWLCFREEFVSGNEIGANTDTACVFVKDYIAGNGETAMVQLLQQSGQVSGVGAFNAALSHWYARHGLGYQPTEILYAIGGEYHDYLVKCRYATFYLPEDWENKHFSALAKDGSFLHESYSDVKRYFETSADQMAYIQQMFGVDEDTSEISVEFLLSGTGGTWAARNQIQLNYHAYIPRFYVNMMFFRHEDIRLHNGSYYEWLYLGLGEYMGQMVPSLYEDEVLLYSVNHENRSYSTLEGDWYEIWQACVEGETNPGQLWRTRWDLMAYYYGTDFSGEGCGYISFTAYLVDRIGLQTLWDYFFVTENECPEIDFAKYRTQWESYLEETYGQYSKSSEYEE